MVKDRDLADNVTKIHRRRGLCFCVFLAFVLLSMGMGRVWADDAVLGIGSGLPSPIRSDQVSLESENVEVYLYRRWAYVEADFVLRNHGPAIELLVGFPEDRRPDAERVGPPLQEFTSELNGVPLPVTYMKASEQDGPPRYPGWYTFKVPLAADSEAVVHNSFLSRPTLSSNGAMYFTYVLETGATWQGRIGQARIALHPSGGLALAGIQAWRGPAEDRSMRRLDHDVEDGSIVWHLTDIEPDVQDDVHARVLAPASEQLTVWADVVPTGTGEELRVCVTDRYGPGWAPGDTVTLLAGQQAMPLGTFPLSSGKSSKNQGCGTVVPLPYLIPSHGRAIEIWGVLSTGQRTESDLVLLNATPILLPGSGEPGIPMGSLVAVGLFLVVAGVAVRLVLMWRGRQSGDPGGYVRCR